MTPCLLCDRPTRARQGVCYRPGCQKVAKRRHRLIPDVYEYVLQYERRRRSEHPDASRKWRQAHPEAVKAYSRKYWQALKEDTEVHKEYLLYRRVWRQQNRERLNAIRRGKPPRSSLAHLNRAAQL